MCAAAREELRHIGVGFDLLRRAGCSGGQRTAHLPASADGQREHRGSSAKAVAATAEAEAAASSAEAEAPCGTACASPRGAASDPAPDAAQKTGVRALTDIPEGAPASKATCKATPEAALCALADIFEGAPTANTASEAS